MRNNQLSRHFYEEDRDGQDISIRIVGSIGLDELECLIFLLSKTSLPVGIVLREILVERRAVVARRILKGYLVQ